MIKLNLLTPQVRLVETLGRYRFGIEYGEQGQKTWKFKAKARNPLKVLGNTYILGNAKRLLKIL